MIPIESAGALLLLALTDSLSFGTLLVPVWLLMAPGKMHPHRILLYLSTVAAVYYGIGIVLMAGGRALLEGATGLLDSPTALVARLAIGVALFILSFALDTKPAQARAAERAARSGRVMRWRERAMTDRSAGTLVGLAVVAVLIEVASMLPYLVATGIITTQAPGWPEALTMLAAYCVVMILPALALAAARLFAHPLIEAPLRRLDTLLTTHGRSTTLWIIGISGIFLATTGAQDLGWLNR